MMTTTSHNRASTDAPRSGLLTPAEAAAYLRVADITLAVWRSCGRYALPYVKVGRRVYYRRSDLDDWLASRVVDAGTPRKA